MVLKDKIRSLLNAKDCTGLRVECSSDYYLFVLTRENDVRTTNEFELLTEIENTSRVFFECYTEHNHDNLLKDSRFNALIRKSSMEFLGCSGGYITDYSMAYDTFTVKDEIEVKVYFKVGSKEKTYKLDLNRMELSKEYF